MPQQIGIRFISSIGVFHIEMEDGEEVDHWVEDLGIYVHVLMGIGITEPRDLSVLSRHAFHTCGA